MDLFATGEGQAIGFRSIVVIQPACGCNVNSDTCELLRLAKKGCEMVSMEKLFTRKEAAEILGISIATLDAARNNGLIAYVQYVQNGCVYFTSAAIQEYIAKCTHRAKPVEKNSTYRKPQRPKR